MCGSDERQLSRNEERNTVFRNVFLSHFYKIRVKASLHTTLKHASIFRCILQCIHMCSNFFFI